MEGMEPTPFEIIVHTRFSVFDPTKPWFRMNTGSAEDVRAHLFSKERLLTKFKAFSTLTLPSLLSQTFRAWTWYIYCSDQLPAEHYKQLMSLCRDPRIHVLPVSGFIGESRNVYRTTTCTTITVRLDDDDAIHSTLFEKIIAVASSGAPVGTFIGPTKGHRVSITDDSEILTEKESLDFFPRFWALGLARIGMSVFDAGGSHFNIHENPSHSVHYITDPEMFLLFTGPATDTKRRFNSKGAKKLDVDKWLLPPMTL
jgi:hypothetical protein